MFDYQPKTNELRDKVILVTGAGDGIGKVAAKTYASLGATVILLGRTTSKLETTYDEIIADQGPEPAIVPLDLKGATLSHYQQMNATIEQEFGHLDGLLHNASLLGHLRPFSQIPLDEWQEVMQVNVTAEFMMTQALLPTLQKAEKASIIFTSSGVGRKGRAHWGSYAVSKFATEGMMQVLADEFENSSMRFNCINPGATRTDMRASAYPGEDPKTLKTPEQIMPLYCYLMSDASAETTGQSLDAQPKR
ncbi:putative oxidoreductase YciK [Saliniradius amylolyticus]|uniref:Putative oxidoreductase YciK n=1 Tax=Saliniradius amylolyticus TaxID=2183582 RepID=A0A2S2E431_9ALTE|nr:YciK family oxidoreductase [Saliniradius amylolyticus]AWL11767.1 putative oxidoreductase YciK [Saliniradius amylolyticus]